MVKKLLDLSGFKPNQPLAKFMQGRHSDVSQRHYYLGEMDRNYDKWFSLWKNVHCPANVIS